MSKYAYNYANEFDVKNKVKELEKYYLEINET